MTKWETAKLKLDNMEFPTHGFREYEKKHEGEEQMYGITKYKKTHKQKKASHNGSRVIINDMLKINGFHVTFIRDYCFECARAFSTRGILFHDGDNICYERVFTTDKVVKEIETFDDALLM